jgi:hypothetical protein
LPLSTPRQMTDALEPVATGCRFSIPSPARFS